MLSKPWIFQNYKKLKSRKVKKQGKVKSPQEKKKKLAFHAEGKNIGGISNTSPNNNPGGTIWQARV